MLLNCFYLYLCYVKACTYHPGKYVMSCPPDCKYAGEAQPGYSCMAHYRWRWSCCGIAKDEPFMANGCQSRFHVAAEDALYKHLVEEEVMRARHRAAQEKEEKDRVEDLMINVRERGNQMLRKVQWKVDASKTHLPILHSLRSDADGGTYAAQQLMDGQNQEKIKKIWGPAPHLYFASKRAQEQNEFQHRIDSGEVFSEFAARRHKLVHPDSDDELF